MSDQQQVVGEVRQMIETLVEADRDRVHRHAAYLRGFLEQFGVYAGLAFALVGAELAAREGE